MTLHLNWRREALYVTLVAAEMCWLTPWSLAITRRTEGFTPYTTALTLGSLVLAVIYFSRILDHLQLDILYQRMVLIVAVVISTPLIMRSLLYPSYGWLDFGWLGKAGEALLRFYSLPPEVSISAAALFLWWRGISIGQRNLTFQGVAFSFRLGVLLIVLSVPLLATSAVYDPTAFILPFFFFSLMAVALARVEEVNRAKGGVGAPFNVTWLTILLGTIASVLVVAWLVAQVYSIEGFSRVFRWLKPAFDPLLKVAEYFLTLVGKLLAPFLQWLIEMFQGFFEGLNQNVEDFNLTPVPPPAFSDVETVQPPRLLMEALRYICLGLAGASVLAVLALGLRRRLDRQRRGHEIRESIWSSASLTDGVLNSLRGSWDRLRELGGLVGRFGPGMRLYAAVSIRKIYANMTRLAERHGFPRQPAQTPYEYLPTLARSFPDCQAETAAITEAYVKVHYGEAPESMQELQQIREHWERIHLSYKNVKREDEKHEA